MVSLDLVLDHVVLNGGLDFLHVLPHSVNSLFQLLLMLIQLLLDQHGLTIEHVRMLLPHAGFVLEFKRLSLELLLKQVLSSFLQTVDH